MPTVYCKHYHGMLSKPACDAGQDPREFRTTSPFRLPCVQEHGVSDRCPLVEYPNAEEQAERKRRDAAEMERLMLAMRAVEGAAGTERPVRGEVPCPACGTGTIRFSLGAGGRSGGAACSTEGCVRWMS